MGVSLVDEVRSALWTMAPDDLAKHLIGGLTVEESGLDLERYEARPGRESLVARIEGRDPNAPTLLLMGHTDVVPANADGWMIA